jgi:hypothetical protein
MRFFLTKRQGWLHGFIFRWALPTAIIHRSFRAFIFSFLNFIKKVNVIALKERCMIAVGEAHRNIEAYV